MAVYICILASQWRTEFSPETTLYCGGTRPNSPGTIDPWIRLFQDLQVHNSQCISRRLQRVV